METNKNIFKVGDKVFDYTYGWGIVYDNDDFTIRVKFDSINNNTVLFWGILLKTLSFTEYTLEGFSQERPEPLPKRGDVVWVRDFEDDNWEVSMFLEYNTNEPDGPYIVSPNMIEGDHECWRYLTTKNPYANENNN